MVLVCNKARVSGIFQMWSIQTVIPAYLKDGVECWEGEAAFSHHLLNGQSDEPVTKAVD